MDEDAVTLPEEPPELTDITYRDFEIGLPEGHDAFGRLFHVEFSVGNTPWRNRKEVCMKDKPGHNWIGPNFKNRIFAQCGDPNKLRHVRDALPFGQHTITAVARLPGSPLELNLEPTQVDLLGKGCDLEIKTDAPAKSHGCGCNAFNRSPGPGRSFVLSLLFVVLFAWRRCTS